MITHFINTTVDELKNDIDVYTSHNMDWIRKVGVDFFTEMDVAQDVYVKEVVSGVRKFDAIAILLACISHNFHAMLLLQKSYWTTRCQNNYAMTFIKLAFVGQGVFKFIVPCQMETQEEGDVAKNTVADAHVAKDDDNHDNTDLEQDLVETGLLPTDKEDTESTDDEKSNVNDSRENDFEVENLEDHSDAGDIDPLPMDIENTD